MVGPAKDAARIPGIDVGVDERTGWEFDGRKVQVLEVPAHTRGAITFVIDGNAFTGDTLFLMGCGRLFEGDAAMMWNSLSKLMTLPDQTLIYCGHEYTQSNGKFALTLEPGNTDLQARVKSLAVPSVPATLGDEKKTNPFLRPDSAGNPQEPGHGEGATPFRCSAKSGNGRTISEYLCLASLSSLSNGDVTTSTPAPTTSPAAPTAVVPTPTTAEAAS